jgi:hypothetical protein
MTILDLIAHVCLAAFVTIYVYANWSITVKDKISLTLYDEAQTALFKDPVRTAL